MYLVSVVSEEIIQRNVVILQILLTEKTLKLCIIYFPKFHIYHPYNLSPSEPSVTIHGTAICIRKSSQQAVCRFCEALSFAHVGGGSCFTGSLQQQIFAYVQAQRSNLLL
jgi:hypothetical protein